MNSPSTFLIQMIFVLAVAPGVTGLVRLCKARLQGRRGAPPWLVYFALATTLRKEHVISESRSWIFSAVPFVVLASAIFLVAVLPLISPKAAIIQTDIFVLAGVLTLGAVFLVMGALDSASAFDGMGASREMTLAALVEPVLIVALSAFAIVNKSTDLETIFSLGASIFLHPALLLSFLALIFVALCENARYPVDNPATHLELTMVHEAMVLEYSGPYLAMLEYASSLKLTIFMLMLSSLILPSTFFFFLFGESIAALLWAPAALLIMSVLLAVLESSMAKMRFYRMQEYMTFAFICGLAGLVLTLIL